MRRAHHPRHEIAARHLRCGSDDASIVEACATAADSICDAIDPTLTPDERLEALADRLSIEFSVARTDGELDKLVHAHAARGDGGFLLHRAQYDKDLIASVIHRQNARPDERRFAALVDARGSKSFMEFFSKAHEMAHPMLEPQLEWEFRNETAKRDAWERLVDQAGSAMVFRGDPWNDALSATPWTKRGADIAALRELRTTLHSEVSLTALTIAAANAVGHAVIVVWACLGTSRNSSTPVLRLRSIVPNTHAAAWSVPHVPRNHRVPESSPISRAFYAADGRADFEQLGDWTGSAGSRLPQHRIWTAAEPANDGVLAVMDFGARDGW